MNKQQRIELGRKIGKWFSKHHPNLGYLLILPLVAFYLIYALLTLPITLWKEVQESHKQNTTDHEEYEIEKE